VTVIAKVTAVGLMTGIAAGGTFVIASSEGKSDSAQVTVTAPPPPDPTLGAELPPPLAQSTGSAFYVATNTGSDANPGTITQPWKTIQKAMDALQPGQKAYVRAGLYLTGGTFGTTGDRWVWSANCTASAPCSVLAYPGERPVLHGQVRLDGSYLRLSGVVIEGPLSRNVTSATERRAMQVEITAGAHHIEFSHNEVRDNDYHAGIYLSTCHDIQILGNHIHDNGRFTVDLDPLTGSGTVNVDHGIYWHDTNGGGNVFANNLVEHNRGSGLHLYPNAHDMIVTQNTFVNNGKEGVLISSTSDRLTVINNVATFNERHQIRVQAGAANLIQNNVIFSPRSSWSVIENTAGATVKDNIVADPLFVARLGHDFHLLAASPAIDRALAGYSMKYDYDKATRPRGVLPDLGAFER
jgi:hypothetical protein